MAADSAGNLYIADSRNHRIRKVDSAGVITTVAGTGEDGFSGDGGPATEARLINPTGVATDGAGNLFIAESGNHRIRTLTRASATGPILSAVLNSAGVTAGVAPNSTASLSGERLATETLSASGRPLPTELAGVRIEIIDVTGVARTVQLAYVSPERINFRMPAEASPGAARLRLTREGEAPVELAITISDPLSIPVRADGSLDLPPGAELVRSEIRTIAGSAECCDPGDGGPAVQAWLAVPEEAAVDAAGNVFVADTSNHRVRRVDALTGVITTVAGNGQLGYGGDGGPAAEAQLSYPYDVATDSEGNVYVTDRFNYRVRKIGAGTGVITTLAGTGSPTGGWSGGAAAAARLRFPHSVAVDAAGTLFFADTHHRVWKLDASGLVAALAGTGEPGYSGDGDPATAAQLSDPRGVAVDTAGKVYVADHGNHRLRKIDAMGTITTLAGTGERGNGGDGGPATEALFVSPSSVATDSAGNVFVADTNNRRVRKIDATSGNIETVFETDGYPALAVAVDEDGNVYVGGGRQVRVIDAGGEASVIAGTGAAGFSGDGQPAGGAELSVSGMAVDRFGAVWFSDSSNHRIRVLEPSPGQN